MDNAQLGRQELLDGAAILKSSGAGLTEAQAAAARVDFQKAQRHFDAAHASLTESRINLALGWVPFARTQLRAGQELTDMGARAAHAGQLALDALAVYLQPGAASGQGATRGPGERVLGLLDALDPRFDAITAELHQVAADRARMPNSGLVPQLARAVQQFDAKVNLKDLEAQLAAFRGDEPAIRSFLAASGSRTYLVLQQDPAELRATGGFIGSVAYLSFDHAKMAPYQPKNVYDIDGDSFGALLGAPGSPRHVDPPLPLETVFRLQSWELRDSNWSPDFPTSARQAEFFLDREIGRKVDGVIAIDPFLISQLLAVIGPTTVPETGDVVDAKNFFATTLTRVELHQGPGQKKIFLTYAAKAIFARLLEVKPIQYRALLEALGSACESRSLQAYFDDVRVEAFVNRHHCGGEVVPFVSDGVMIVDSNLAGAKDDFWLQRSFSLQLQVRPDGSVQHSLHLHYDGQHLGPGPLTGRWGYTGWLRVYVPVSSSVVSVHGASLQTGQELGRKVLAGWLSVKYGSTVDVIITYDLEGAGRHFDLLWQKQAGRQGDPISVQISLPTGWSLHSTRVGNDPAVGKPVTMDLAVDRIFIFDYGPS